MRPSTSRMTVVLPAPLGPRKPNTSPLQTVHVEAVDRAQAAELLGERVGGQDGGAAVAAVLPGPRPLRFTQASRFRDVVRLAGFHVSERNLRTPPDRSSGTMPAGDERRVALLPDDDAAQRRRDDRRLVAVDRASAKTSGSCLSCFAGRRVVGVCATGRWCRSPAVDLGGRRAGRRVGRLSGALRIGAEAAQIEQRRTERRERHALLQDERPAERPRVRSSPWRARTARAWRPAPGEKRGAVTAGDGLLRRRLELVALSPSPAARRPLPASIVLVVTLAPAGGVKANATGRWGPNARCRSRTAAGLGPALREHLELQRHVGLAVDGGLDVAERGVRGDRRQVQQVGVAAGDLGLPGHLDMARAAPGAAAWR